MVHFVPFVKGVVPFLKGDGQLVKGADSLKLLSKLAVFPLLLISKILNFANFGKILAMFSKKCDFRAVQRSALCRSRRELPNAYLLAKFGSDAAENEPCQVCPIGAKELAPSVVARWAPAARPP